MREGLYIQMQGEEICHVTILIEIPSFVEMFLTVLCYSEPVLQH